MTKPYYECHVTIMGESAFVRYCVESIAWKFSVIDGDPSLGDGVKCYATRHYNADKLSQDEVVNLLTTAAESLRSKGCATIREKVELVLYDKRTPI